MILSLEIPTVHRVGLGGWFVCILWRFDQSCSAALGRLSSQSTALCGKWRSNSNPMELHYTLDYISRTLRLCCLLSWILWRLHGEWLCHKAIDERSVETGATHGVSNLRRLSISNEPGRIKGKFMKLQHYLSEKFVHYPASAIWWDVEYSQIIPHVSLPQRILIAQGECTGSKTETAKFFIGHRASSFYILYVVLIPLL